MPDQNSLFDICIIGSGAGGGPIAADLAKKGLKVVILERGRRFQGSEIRKDEFTVCRMPQFHPGLLKGSREICYGKAPVVTANHLWTGVCVGGGTRVMSGFFFRMQKDHFSPHTEFGPIAGATHQDWPISYDDLAHFYDRVEYDIGMSGSADQTPGKERPFPFAPLKAHAVSTLIDESSKTLGYHTFPTPRAVLSQDAMEQDRGKCSYSGFCGSYACMTGAKGSTDETYIKTGLKTGNITLLTNHYVYRLESDGDRITYAHYFDREHIPGKIKARIFVVACSSIETARLLLNSPSEQFPQGLSNKSGQVGKNLTFTIPCEVTGFFNKKLFPSSIDSPSPFVQRSTQDFTYLEDGSIRYKHGGTVVFILPHPNPIRQMILLSYDQKGQRIFGKALKEKARQFYSYNHLQSDSFIDFLPNENTAVSVSSRIKDWWGIPSAHITINPHEESIRASHIIARKIAQLFTHMGAEKVAFNPSPFTAGELQQGTCRFGTDPKIAVLDPFCRSFSVKNLFITDGSFLPSGIPVPSTFTIMANSLRVSDYIYKKA